MYPYHSVNTPEDATGEILQDVKRNGKVNDWKGKKLINVSYAELLHILQFKKAERVRECGEILEFGVTDEGRLKLANAWFCKSRLCPICNWRMAMKHSGQTQQVVTEVVKRKPKARWLFLTLSTRNAIDGETLHEELQQMTKAFNKLKQYKKVKKNLIGFMRATEVTVNEEEGTYNQHLHILLCVESTFFWNTENYISQKQWTELWQKALKVNYRPVVHVQTIKPKNKHKSDLKSAIDETAKYPVKHVDYLSGDQERDLEVVDDLEKGLYRKRMLSYGGLLKTIHKELNLDDVEEGDLVQTDDPEDEEEEFAYHVVAAWNWEKKNYFISNKE
jgi:plasmid rolling circle replication initiator protein Rep